MLLRRLITLLFACVVSCSFELPAFSQVLSPDPAIAPVLSSPIVSTREYDFNGAIQRYVEQSKRPTKEEARTEAIQQLFAPFEGPQPTLQPVKWKEVRPNVFRVEGTEIQHQQVNGVAQWMLFDFKQITIETQILSISEETLKSLHRKFARQWKMSRSVVDANATTNATVELQVQPPSTNDLGHPLESFASSSKTLPCRVAKLSETQTKTIVLEQQGDAKSNLLQAPKVTVFPGQPAVLKDVTHRPFVVSVQPSESGKQMLPVIEVLEDGMTIDLKADLLAGDQLQISSAIKFNRIGDVDTFTFDTDEVSGVSVQIPEQHTRNVRLGAKLAGGETLLIDPHFFTEETVKRRFRKDKTVRKYTLILVTPRIILPQDEVVGDAKIAKL